MSRPKLTPDVTLFEELERKTRQVLELLRKPLALSPKKAAQITGVRLTDLPSVFKRVPIKSWPVTKDGKTTMRTKYGYLVNDIVQEQQGNALQPDRAKQIARAA